MRTSTLRKCVKSSDGGLFQGDAMASLTNSRKLPNGNPNPNYYIRIWLPKLRKYKYISTKTKNKREAQYMLNQINKAEWKVRVGFEDDIMTSANSLTGNDKDMTLRTMIQRFLTSRAKDVEETTLSTYDLALRNLVDAFSPTMNVLEFNPESYDLLVSYLKDRKGISDVTVNIRLRGVRTFMNWLVERRILKDLPFTCKQLKLPKRYSKFIPPHEMTAIEAHIEHPAVSSAVCVYVNTGLRKSELAPENHTLEGDGSFLRVVGKGNKERIVPLPSEVLSHYHNFLKSGISVDYVSKAFTSARKKAGINDNAKSLHALRHTTTYRLVKSGMSLSDIRDILGHSTVQMTEHYARVGIEYLNAELKDESAYVWDVRPLAYA